MQNLKVIILKYMVIGFVFTSLLIPSEIFADDPECAYVKWKSGKWGIRYPTWVTCPSTQVCEWLAYPRECRHQPPWENEKCTIFSGIGSGSDPWNFCKDEDNYCKGFDDFLAGTCVPYGKVGEECNGIRTLCANILGNTGRMCRPSYYNLDGSPTGMECYPNGRTFDISSDDDCRNAYSREAHEKVIKNYEESDGNSIYPMTVSYSSGAGLSAVYGVTEEVGIVYSGDGIYACYTSSCTGFGLSAGGKWFVSQGVYQNSYDDFIKGERLTDVSVDAMVAGISYATVRDEDWEKVGEQVTFWAGIDVIPVPVGGEYITCGTDPIYQYNWDPIAEELVSAEPPPLECKNTSVCANAETCLGDVSISARPGLEPVFVVQEPLGPYEIGIQEITLKAISDEEIASCSAIGEVIDCTPPELTCPTIIEECTSSEGAYINPPNPSYTDCTDVELGLPDVGTYPLGETVVLYYATDIDNNQSACQAIVNVVDTTGPLIESIVAEPNMLRPPNHKMRRVELDMTATDTCGSEVQCKVIGITMNDQGEGTGDGNTVGDAFILDNQTVALRAERSGKGQGRVYTIAVECTDVTGNSTVEGVEVRAPHDSKKD
jgi:hypothetical protein